MRPRSAACRAAGCGICLAGWNETDFHVRITPRQPLGWLASDGVSGFSTVPAEGVRQVRDRRREQLRPRRQQQCRQPHPAGSRRAVHRLRCAASRSTRMASRSTATSSRARQTIEVNDGRANDFITVAKANAIGIQAIEGAVNDDNVLVLGGPDAEYNGCPNFLILNHFFDFAEDPVTDDGSQIVTILSWYRAARTTSARSQARRWCSTWCTTSSSSASRPASRCSASSSR